MRFIRAVRDIRLKDLLTDQFVSTASWTDAIRVLFSDARIHQQMDVFSAIDLRKKLLALKEGEAAAVDERDWAVIVEIVRRPVTFTAAFIHGDGAEEFFRAFIDAPTKNPEPG